MVDRSESVRRLVCGAIASLGVVSLAAWVAEWSWRLGLLEHLRPLYGLLLLLISFGVWRRQRAWAMIGYSFAALNLGLVGLAWQPLDEPAGSLPIISTLHINIDRHNPDPDQILPYIRAAAPDILLIQEITPENLPILLAGLPDYHLIAAEPRENSHGSAILSAGSGPDKLMDPVRFKTLYLPATSERPLLAVWFSVAERPVVLLSLHTTRPRSHWTVQTQAEEFAAVSAWSQQQQQAGNEVLLVGDFNTTPWSKLYGNLLSDGNLDGAGSSWWQWGSWPAAAPFLPIDLAVGSGRIHFVGQQRGPVVGSDHRPII